MKFFQKLLFKRREYPHSHLNYELCQQHDQYKYPDLLANHHCTTCDTEICYMCAHPHFDHGCIIKWDYPLVPTGIELIDKFNLGYKALLNWKELECICGKPWSEGPTPTICMSCGSATCSDECHLKLQEEEKCLMFTNFTPHDLVFNTINGFRSILLENIKMMDIGDQVSFGSPRFMIAYKYSEFSITLERGFREYGNPASTTLKSMEIIEESPSFEHRICDCDCKACEESVHPVYNCLSYCEKSETKRLEHIECWCVCSECILKGAHSRKDCYYFCKSVLR